MARAQQALTQIELNKLQGKPQSPEAQRLAANLATQLVPGQQDIARQTAAKVHQNNQQKRK